MLELDLSKVFEHMNPIVIKLPHKAADVEESVDSVRQREVISLGQDLDTVRESALATHCLLESGTGSSAAVHLAIEQADVDQLAGEGHDVGAHDLGGVSSGEGPDNVASCVADVCTDGMITKVDVVD
mmetsp:Transcript_22679/g.30269  ORF Transcript_22679/g.30269 Transcript_22679/m.30269 type:complete len:127 (+) Transcript_22679:2162-2542(+)